MMMAEQPSMPGKPALPVAPADFTAGFAACDKLPVAPWLDGGMGVRDIEKAAPPETDAAKHSASPPAATRGAMEPPLRVCILKPRAPQAGADTLPLTPGGMTLTVCHCTGAQQA
mmetsp:Transcript_36162/g.84769  ORF Transcript_36162/g.84769 Transcript_36162/m.84769 type:complete len:114 (-) Transcript_36162:1-342(-)